MTPGRDAEAMALWGPHSNRRRAERSGRHGNISIDAVTAPALLIVGGRDEVVLGLNRKAMASMHAALAIVPEATHLFEEPGTLHAAAELAREWFLGHV